MFKYQVGLFELHLEIGGVGARMERMGLQGLRACLLGHVTRPKTRRTHNECSIGPFAQNRKRFRRCEFNRCKVECAAVSRLGTAPRTHAGSATCRAPTEEITRAKERGRANAKHRESCCGITLAQAGMPVQLKSEIILGSWVRRFL